MAFAARSKIMEIQTNCADCLGFLIPEAFRKAFQEIFTYGFDIVGML